MDMGIKNFYRGDSLSYKIIINDKTNNPIDITGYTIWITMKSNPNMTDKEAEIHKSVTNHINPINGTTIITIDSETTDQISQKTKLYYDIQIKFPDSNVKTLYKGEVWVLEDITRSV